MYHMINTCLLRTILQRHNIHEVDIHLVVNAKYSKLRCSDCGRTCFTLSSRLLYSSSVYCVWVIHRRLIAAELQKKKKPFWKFLHYRLTEELRVTTALEHTTGEEGRGFIGVTSSSSSSPSSSWLFIYLSRVQLESLTQVMNLTKMDHNIWLT